MALPIWMLRKLQMRRSRKVGLAALFLIALIDVAFDIARTVYTVDGGAVALDTLWDILEPAIAVMISALLTYKALLGRSERKKSISYENLKRDEKQSSAFNSADKYNWGPTVAGQASSHGGSIDVSIHELARVSKDAAFTNTAV